MNRVGWIDTDAIPDILSGGSIASDNCAVEIEEVSFVDREDNEVFGDGVADFPGLLGGVISGTASGAALRFHDC